MGFCSLLADCHNGFEAEGGNEGIEFIDNALIEAIKLRLPLSLKQAFDQPVRWGAATEDEIVAQLDRREEQWRAYSRSRLFGWPAGGGLGASEVAIDEFCRDGPSAPPRSGCCAWRPVRSPCAEMIGDLAQCGARHRIDLSMCIEEADDLLGLLEG
jgi:hypothetical protein